MDKPKYKISEWHQVGSEYPVQVVSRNGKTVAKCKTFKWAESVCKGLNMVEDEKRRMANFRI